MQDSENKKEHDNAVEIPVFKVVAVRRIEPGLWVSKEFFAHMDGDVKIELLIDDGSRNIAKDSTLTPE